MWSTQGREQQPHATDVEPNAGAMLRGLARVTDQRLIPAA